jgi:hypothetical protein
MSRVLRKLWPIFVTEIPVRKPYITIFERFTHTLFTVPQDYEDLLSYYTKRGYRVIAIAGKSIDGLSWLKAQRMKRYLYPRLRCCIFIADVMPGNKQNLGCDSLVWLYLKIGLSLGLHPLFRRCVQRTSHAE